MADPLHLLRTWTINKKPVIFENDNFRFDNITFPRNVVTNFRTNKGEGEPYTLDALWFMLQNAELKYSPDYLNECKKFDFPRVSLVDKKALISYLRGETDHCINIVPTTVGLPLLNEKTQIGESHPRSEDNEVPLAKRPKIEEDEILKAEKEEAAKRLDAPKVKTNIADSQIDLGSGLNAEKINELKMKRQLVKRGTIKGDDEAKAVQPTRSKFMDLDAVVTKNIMDRERLVRTRITVLRSNKKQFRSIIDKVQEVLRKENQEKSAIDARNNTYDRYGKIQEDKFWKEKLKGAEPEEFAIDTRGSFANGALMSGKLPDQKAEKKKTPLKSKSPKGTKTPDKNFIPIIIVPSALTSLITIFNVKEFLIDGVFIPSMDKKKDGAKKENSIFVERKTANGNTTKYQVITDASIAKLQPHDWNRIIAVFATGASWQFKNWEWKTPVEIFSKVKGYFVQYEDEKTPDSIAQWDIKVLTVGKTITRKHVAQTASVEFWKAIDNYLRAKKPDVFQSVYY